MPAARDIKESVVDAAGEHISEEFKEKCVELGIVQAASEHPVARLLLDNYYDQIAGGGGSPQ